MKILDKLAKTYNEYFILNQSPPNAIYLNNTDYLAYFKTIPMPLREENKIKLQDGTIANCLSYRDCVVLKIIYKKCGEAIYPIFK